jgi:hypothetical protein
MTTPTYYHSATFKISEPSELTDPQYAASGFSVNQTGANKFEVSQIDYLILPVEGKNGWVNSTPCRTFPDFDAAKKWADSEAQTALEAYPQ